MSERGRWAALFADLEGELDAAWAADDEAEVRDRARREMARMLLVERLTASLGRPVAVRARGAGTVRGTLADVAADWLLVDDGAEVLLATRAVLAVDGLTPGGTRPTAVGAARGLGFALRALARRRVPVRVTLVDGEALVGTFDRVGADFAELAEHGPDEPRRAANVRAVRVLPFAALAAVREV